MSGRTSSRMPIFSKSASQRSGVSKRVVGSEQHLLLEQRVRILHERRREILRRPPREIDVHLRFVQADGDRLVLPRERRMRHDDRHVREIDRHIVDRHRMAVLQPDAAAASHPGSDSAVSGVKEHRQARFREDLVERIRDAIVGEELLQRRMQLQAANAAAGDEPPRLAHRFGASCRIEADERHRDIGVPGGEFDDGVVGDLRPSGQLLVDGEDDAADLPRAVVLGERVPIAIAALRRNISRRRRRLPRGSRCVRDGRGRRSPRVLRRRILKELMSYGDHARGRRRRIKLVDRLPAIVQYRFLIQGTLVGHLAGVE